MTTIDDSAIKALCERQGDFIYYIGEGEVDECMLCGVGYNHKAELEIYFADSEGIYKTLPFTDLEKTIFLTREKAAFEANEPLAWQHRSEQDRIDRALDAKHNNNTEPAEVGIEMFFKQYQ